VCNSKEATEVAHMFYLQFNDEVAFHKYSEHMKANKVTVTTHYQSLHNSSFATKFLKSIPQQTNAEKITNSLVRLPLWIGLTKENVNEIILKSNEIITNIKGRKQIETR
jgi:dTDP-4-amino-4,6-dideoxygalactose transaminase